MVINIINLTKIKRRCKLTRENETKPGKRWWPELFYIFVTAVIHDPKSGELLFTRSKDREEWIPGAGGELVIPAKTDDPIFLQTTALKETAEELYAKKDKNGDQVGLSINIKGDVPFYIELHCGELSRYGKDPETKEPIHMLLAYFLAELTDQNDKYNIKSKNQPDEEDCETVDIAWMTIETFQKKIDLGEIKTFPNIIRVLKSPNLKTAGNPFTKIWQ